MKLAVPGPGWRLPLQVLRGQRPGHQRLRPARRLHRHPLRACSSPPASESELAGVLAHEISHVTQRHISRAVFANQRSSILTMAAMLGAILLGAVGGSGDVITGAIATAQGVAAQQQINFTRANEYEADRVGVGVLAAAGFDPMGMPAFFETLARQTGPLASQAPEFLRTHPVTVNRIAETRERAAALPRPDVRDAAGLHHHPRPRPGAVEPDAREGPGVLPRREAGPEAGGRPRAPSTGSRWCAWNSGSTGRPGRCSRDCWPPTPASSPFTPDSPARNSPWATGTPPLPDYEKAMGLFPAQHAAHGPLCRGAAGSTASRRRPTPSSSTCSTTCRPPPSRSG